MIILYIMLYNLKKKATKEENHEVNQVALNKKVMPASVAVSLVYTHPYGRYSPKQRFYYLTNITPYNL